MTFTPSITPTPEPPSEAELCASFSVVTQSDGTTYTAGDVGVLFQIGADNRVFVRTRIRFEETDDLIADGYLRGGRQQLIVVDMAQFPQDGSYLWEFTLFDAQRSDFCEHAGQFVIQRPLAPEVTPDITEAVEVTPEITPEVQEVTPEVTESVSD